MKLPLTTVNFIHTMEPVPNVTQVAHRIEMTGLLSGLFGATLERQLQAGLGTAVVNLIRLAEQANEQVH